MTKICVEDGCKNQQFGGGYCKYHQYRRKMCGGDLFKPKTRQRKAIPAESPKRKKEKKYYIQEIKELRKECKANGTYICFFCNKVRDNEELQIHHLRGRTGKFYIDKEFFVWSHSDCHMKFHQEDVDDLMKEEWYEGFMARLRAKDSHSYYKQKKREEKSQLDFDF